MDVEAMLARARAARERAEAATPGRWVQYVDVDGEWGVATCDDPTYPTVASVPQTAHALADAVFIAGARQNVPALVADVVALVERVRALEGIRDDVLAGRIVVSDSLRFRDDEMQQTEDRLRAYVAADPDAA